MPRRHRRHRHPVHRVVSAFHYCRTKKHNWDPLCASDVMDSTEASLAEFARHWGNYGVRQMMMSYIPAETVMRYVDEVVGDGRPAALNGVPVEKIPSWVLLKFYLQHGYPYKSGGARTSAADDDPETTAFNDDRALSEWMGEIQSLICNNYSAIGVVEEYDTTLALFNGVGIIPGKNWTATYWKLGAANTNDAPKERSAALRYALASDEIKKYLRLDLLLYEHAVSVFRDMVWRNGIVPP